MSSKIISQFLQNATIYIYIIIAAAVKFVLYIHSSIGQESLQL